MAKSIGNYLVAKKYIDKNGKENNIYKNTFKNIPKKYRYIKEINYGNQYDNWKRFGNIYVYQNERNIADTGIVTADFETRNASTGDITNVDVNTWADGSIGVENIIGIHTKVCSLTLDLGSEQIIDCIRLINGYSSDGRSHKFDLLCSSDGESWDVIYSYALQGECKNPSYGTVFPVKLSGNNGVLTQVLVGNRKQGETDDTQSIQRAINLATISCGKVKLEPKKYEISSTIYLDRNCVLEGSGINTTKLVLKENSNCSMIKCKNKTTHWIGIDNLEINGNGMNQMSSNSAVVFNTWVSGYLKNLYITEVYGEGLVLGNGAMDLLISNVWVMGCKVGKNKYQIDINSEYIDTSNKNGLITSDSLYSEWAKVDWYKVNESGDFINDSSSIILTLQNDGTYKNSSNVLYERISQSKFKKISDSSIVTANSLGLVKSNGMYNQADRGKAIRIACGVNLDFQKLHIEMSDTCIIQGNHVVNINSFSSSYCGKDGNDNPILDIRGDNKIVKIGNVSNHFESGVYFSKNLGDYSDNVYPIDANPQINTIVYGSNNNLGRNPIVRGALYLENTIDSMGNNENSIIQDDGVLKIVRGYSEKDVIASIRFFDSVPDENTIGYYIGQRAVTNYNNVVKEYKCSKITLTTTTTELKTDGSQVSQTSVEEVKSLYQTKNTITNILENGNTQEITYSYKFVWDVV